MNTKLYASPDYKRATLLQKRSRQQAERSRDLSESEASELSSLVSKGQSAPLVSTASDSPEADRKENIREVREWAEYIFDARAVQPLLALSDEKMAELINEFLETYFTAGVTRMSEVDVDEFVQWAVTPPYRRHI